MSEPSEGTPSAAERDGAITAQTLPALEALASDSSGEGQLEKLEDALSEFNMFEALGIRSAELRHSNMLAWLLDPNGSHALGDIIVRRILQRAVMGGSSKISAIDLDLMDLADLEVRREWANIDVLLVCAAQRLVVVIENKIEAAEGPGQLRAYRERVERDFPGDHWRRLYLFLTMEGDDPSDDAYLKISHRDVVQLLEATLRLRRGAVSADVALMVDHYTRMLRRHYMEDSELIRLARQLYSKHRRAFDFIFAHNQILGPIPRMHS